MSEVDRYLDEMFNQLSRTGGAGRRVLSEVEDHLRTAVADGIASGQSQQQAEHLAVQRFGSTADFARQLHRAQHRPWLVAVSSIWLLAGLGLATLAISYLAAALLRSLLPQPNLPLCSQLPASGASECTNTATPNASIVHQTAAAGLLILLLAAVVLLGRELAKRHTGLPAAYRRLPLLAAALFAFAGLYLAFGAEALFIIKQGTGARVSFVASPLALITGVAAAVSGRVRHRRPIHRS
jgi:hypothetical protein